MPSAHRVAECPITDDPLALVLSADIVQEVPDTVDYIRIALALWVRRIYPGATEAKGGNRLAVQLAVVALPQTFVRNDGKRG